MRKLPLPDAQLGGPWKEKRQTVRVGKTTLPSYITERDGSARVQVRLTQRASRTEIVGIRGEALAVKVTAPPVEDQANLALRKLIAKRVGIPPSKVKIVRGQKGRDKLLLLQGVGAVEAAKRLA